MGRSGTYRAAALGVSFAVFGAVPAIAQEQSNVSMYGIADGGVEILNRGTGASTAVRVDSGIAATSRLGIKGSEDLGGGLSAFFTFEGQVNVDAGSGAAAGGGFDFARRSFTGISGQWGQVYLGRDYTPGYLMIRENDIFGYGLNGTLLQFSTAGGVTARASNGIFYYAPVFGGLQIQAMYASGEFDTDPKDRGNIAGIGFLYNSGPFSANAHYQTTIPPTRSSNRRNTASAAVTAATGSG
jgi:general bacterial porin, GBP family